jgi:tripartite-type tricarboxylate transporter receptor subunit TctC
MTLGGFHMLKVSLLTVAALLGLAISVGSATAEDYPSRPVHIIVPFAPGGSTDAVVRILANELSKELNATFVVENRAGGAATIGMKVVASATPDGYTLGAANISFGANPSLLASLPYNSETDFEPVGLVARVPLVLAVHPSVEAKSVKEFIALVKAKPGAITYSTAGHGSGSDLSMALFDYLTGLKMVSVPYTGGAPQVASTIGGHTQALFATIPSALGYFKSGQLRPLGISSARRDPTLPEVPTIAEAGVPGYEMGDWIGIVAPAGTPAQVVGRLNKAIDQALTVPDVKGRIEKIGTQVDGGTPAEFKGFIKAEITRWDKVVKTMGLRVN